MSTDTMSKEKTQPPNEDSREPTKSAYNDAVFEVEKEMSPKEDL